MAENEYVTLLELAEILGISKHEINELIRKGVIELSVNGKFEADACLKSLRKSRFLRAAKQRERRKVRLAKMKVGLKPWPQERNNHMTSIKNKTKGDSLNGKFKNRNRAD